MASVCAGTGDALGRCGPECAQGAPQPPLKVIQPIELVSGSATWAAGHERVHKQSHSIRHQYRQHSAYHNSGPFAGQDLKF